MFIPSLLEAYGILFIGTRTIGAHRTISAADLFFNTSNDIDRTQRREAGMAPHCKISLAPASDNSKATLVAHNMGELRKKGVQCILSTLQCYFMETWAALKSKVEGECSTFDAVVTELPS